eukprot:gene8758-31_t
MFFMLLNGESPLQSPVIAWSVLELPATPATSASSSQRMLHASPMEVDQEEDHGHSSCPEYCPSHATESPATPATWCDLCDRCDLLTDNCDLVRPAATWCDLLRHGDI